MMELLYGNKKIELKKCTSFYSRLKGFMFRKDIKSALLFGNCNSIHTFFMKENIDVIMCDRDDKILYYYRDLPKNKVIWPKKGVSRVYETPKNFFDIKIGERMIVNES